MPSGTEETLHFHRFAQQFFYILQGEAVFEAQGEEIAVHSGEGFHILPNTLHKIKNTSGENLNFLVISQPTTKQDRMENQSKAML